MEQKIIQHLNTYFSRTDIASESLWQKDLGADEIDVMSLVLDFEEMFQVQLPELPVIHSVKDFILVLASCSQNTVA